MVNKRKTNCSHQDRSRSPRPQRSFSPSTPRDHPRHATRGVLVDEQHRGRNHGSLMHPEIQDEHRHHNRERRLEVLKIHDEKHNRRRREDRRNRKFGDSSSIKDRKRQRSKVNNDGAIKEKTVANASRNERKRRESCGNNRGDKKSDSSHKYESQKKAKQGSSRETEKELPICEVKLEKLKSSLMGDSVRFQEKLDKFGEFLRSDLDKDEVAIEKEKPNFEPSGKLAEDTNTYRGVVIKYNEPSDAHMPKLRWRLYPFKGDEPLPVLYIHRQSAYLIGRDRKIADLPVDHPSCSKQHAVFQYRLTPMDLPDGTIVKRIRPYIIDLGSANGTYLNNERIEPQRFVELREKDVLKFGFSTREFVLLNEKSHDESTGDTEMVKKEVRKAEQSPS